MVALWSIKRTKKPSIFNPINSKRNTQELNSGLAPCTHDQEHPYFRTRRDMRRIKPISTSADDMEVDPPSEFTDNSSLELDQEGINPALVGLHEGYSHSFLATLKFYASLARWLKKEWKLQQAALKGLSDGQEENYERRLNELLRHFRETGLPFTEEISAKFQAVYTQQIEIIERLQKQVHKFHKKLKFTKAWIKLSKAIFFLVYAAVIVCSVLAFFVASPPLAAAVAVAAALPLGSIKKWIDSRLKKREQALKRGIEAMEAMLEGSYMAIKDLDRIKAMIDALKVQIHSLFLNPESIITEEGGVQIVEMMQGFMTSMEELADQAEMMCEH